MSRQFMQRPDVFLEMTTTTTEEEEEETSSTWHKVFGTFYLPHQLLGLRGRHVPSRRFNLTNPWKEIVVLYVAIA